jgi:hypothetical protein
MVVRHQTGLTPKVHNHERHCTMKAIEKSSAARPARDVPAMHSQISALISPIPEAGAEPGSVCGRLAYLAHSLFIESTLTHEGLHDVYDVQALLIGAMKCGDATPAQTAIIIAALPMLDQYCDMIEGRGAGTARAAVNFADHRSDDPLPSTPYSRRQLALVMETIAGRATTLESMMMATQEEDDEYMRGVLLDAAVLLITGIGALADSSVGGAIRGEHDDWNYGPNFAESSVPAKALNGGAA